MLLIFIFIFLKYTAKVFVYIQFTKLGYIYEMKHIFIIFYRKYDLLRT